MSIEGFIKLKEIDSLNKMRAKQLQLQIDQENRLLLLDQKKISAKEELDQLTKSLLEEHNSLAEMEKKLKISSEQKERLINFGSDDTKISKLNEEINSLEEVGLEKLSNIDNINSRIADKKTFLSGLSKTIVEISTEVQEEVKNIARDIANLDQRLQLLKDELPDQFRETYFRIDRKNLAHGSFTRIEEGYCFFCRYKISRIDESEIDINKNLKTCPQCSRIFLPYGA